jgi:hypothetical protein
MEVSFPTALINASIKAALDLWRQHGISSLTSANGDVVKISRLNSTALAALSAETQNDISSFPENWPDLEFLPQIGFVAHQSNTTAPTT